VTLAVADLAVEQIERLRFFSYRPVEHRINRAAFGIQMRRHIPEQELTGCDSNERDCCQRTQFWTGCHHENDGCKDQNMALVQHRRGSEPPLLHVARDRKRPDANGDDSGDHWQSAPK
jgi:hypothetical protein